MRLRRVGAAGFTLIEMLAVLAILGSVAAGVTVALRPVRERSLLARSVVTLTDLIARARSAAVRDGRPVLLRFDPEQRTIMIEGTGARASLDTAVTLTLTTAREAGIGTDQAILFLPDGTGSGGLLRLEIAKSGTVARDLRVSWLTGTVTDER